MSENSTSIDGNGRSPKRLNRWTPRAYNKFAAATQPGQRIQVPEDNPEAQAKAGQLIERGVVGYRNRKGHLRDVGVPKREEHRGRVWLWASGHEDRLVQSAPAGARERSAT